mmetsp:Transcript_9703/g.30774  ORF Transcript_9703/g.30774 Transcript_9703/m.30774 type:complete len:90 (+) Transcript_9703:151-420(+)
MEVECTQRHQHHHHHSTTTITNNTNNNSSSSRAGVAFGDNEEFGVLPEAPGVGGVQRRVARSATPDLWEEPQPDLRPNPHTADLTKKGI